MSSERGIVLGICGKARSGKDTFAVMLSEALFDITGKRLTLMSYANELKLRIQRDFDLSYDQLWGDLKETDDNRYPKKTGGFWTPREIMQFVGTDCMRSIDNNFWVKELFRVIDDNDIKDVIITDVRFHNEATPIKEAGGYIIKVNKNLVDEIHNMSHASETSMDTFDVDFFVDNSFNLTALKASAKQVAELILKIKFSEVKNGKSKGL